MTPSTCLYPSCPSACTSGNVDVGSADETELTELCYCIICKNDLFPISDYTVAKSAAVFVSDENVISIVIGWVSDNGGFVVVYV